MDYCAIAEDRHELSDGDDAQDDPAMI